MWLTGKVNATIVYDIAFPEQFDKYTTNPERGEFILRHITQEYAKRSRAKKDATSWSKTMTVSYFTYK